MLNDMLSKLAFSFSRNGADRKSSARRARVNRRYSPCLGIEGLEGRLSLSSVATVGVTVTNQNDASDTSTMSNQDNSGMVTPNTGGMMAC